MVNVFRQFFKDRLFTITRKRVSTEDTVKMPEWKPDTYTEPLDVALDYLSEIVALSRCTSIMGGLTNGTALSLLINNNRYESINIPNKGIQPMIRN